MKYITEINYIHIKDVVSVYNTINGVKITLEAGASFQPLNFTLSTAKLTEKSKIAGGSKLYEQDLNYSFTLEKVDSTVYEEIEGKPVLISYKYNTGENMLLGTIDYPVTLLTKLSVKSNSQYDVICQCSNTYRSKVIIS